MHQLALRIPALSMRTGLRSATTRVNSRTVETVSSNSSPTQSVEDGLREGMDSLHIRPKLCVEESWSDDKCSTKPEGTVAEMPVEYGNKPKGPEPTRFGDWQYKGRSTDF